MGRDRARSALYLFAGEGHSGGCNSYTCRLGCTLARHADCLLLVLDIRNALRYRFPRACLCFLSGKGTLARPSCWSLGTVRHRSCSPIVVPRTYSVFLVGAHSVFRSRPRYVVLP